MLNSVVYFFISLFVVIDCGSCVLSVVCFVLLVCEFWFCLRWWFGFY